MSPVRNEVKKVLITGGKKRESSISHHARNGKK